MQPTPVPVKINGTDPGVNLVAQEDVCALGFGFQPDRSPGKSTVPDGKGRYCFPPGRDQGSIQLETQAAVTLFTGGEVIPEKLEGWGH